MKNGNTTAKMIVEVRNAIRSIHIEDKIIVAVSSGCDSMVLLHLLAIKCKRKHIAVAHINHNIHEEESRKDEQFVRDFCKSHNIDYHSENIFPNEDKLDGESIEMTWRRLRYQALEKIAKREGCKHLATAHNANDQVETILYKMCRSSNVGGIAGMNAIVHTGKLFHIRPLLNIERKDIEEYARFNKVPYRNDSDNTNLAHQRNFIRHKIIPLLLEVNPQAIRHICDISDGFKSVEEAAEKEAERRLGEVVGGIYHCGRYLGSYLCLELMDSPAFGEDMKARILFHWLQKNFMKMDVASITKVELDKIFAKPKGNIKKTIRIGGIWFTIYKGNLFEETIAQSHRFIGKLQFYEFT